MLILDWRITGVALLDLCDNSGSKSATELLYFPKLESNSHLETIMDFRKEKRSPSSTSPCDHLRTAYQHCFNRWYSEKFLKGQWDKEECVTEWQKYRDCLSTSSLAQKNSEIVRTLAAQDEIARTLAEMGRVRNRKMIVPVVKNKQLTVDQVTGEKILKSFVFSMSRKKLPSSLSHLEMDLGN